MIPAYLFRLHFFCFDHCNVVSHELKLSIMIQKSLNSFQFIFDQLNMQADLTVSVDLFLQALHLRCGQRLCHILAHAVPRAHRFQNVHIMLLPEVIIPVSR